MNRDWFSGTFDVGPTSQACLSMRLVPLMSVRLWVRSFFQSGRSNGKVHGFVFKMPHVYDGAHHDGEPPPRGSGASGPTVPNCGGTHASARTVSAERPLRSPGTVTQPRQVPPDERGVEPTGRAKSGHEGKPDGARQHPPRRDVKRGKLPLRGTEGPGPTGTHRRGTARRSSSARTQVRD